MKFKKFKKDILENLVCKTMKRLSEFVDTERWGPLLSNKQVIQLATDCLWKRIQSQRERDANLERLSMMVAETLYWLGCETPADQPEDREIWEIENRLPTVDELVEYGLKFHIIDEEHLGANIENWVDEILLEQSVDVCDDIIQPQPPIEVEIDDRWEYEAELYFKYCGKISEEDAYRIDQWLLQWNGDHFPRLNFPYRNGEYLYVLSSNGGIAVVPSLCDKKKGLGPISLETISLGRCDNYWYLPRKDKYYGTRSISYLETDQKCLETVLDYIHDYATKKIYKASDYTDYILPWNDGK